MGSFLYHPVWLCFLLLAGISSVISCDFPIGRWTNVDEWHAPEYTNCKLQSYDGRIAYNKNITREELALGIQNLILTTECIHTVSDATLLCMFEHFPLPRLGERPMKPVFFNYYATQTPKGISIQFVSGSSTLVSTL